VLNPRNLDQRRALLRRMILRSPAAAGEGSTPAPGIAATAFPTAPSVHYHPNAQAAVVTKSGDQITNCPDLRGLAALVGLSAAGAVVGPRERTDNLCRKFWRFNGAEYARIEAALGSFANRGYMVLIVGRMPHQRNNVVMCAWQYASYTSDAVNVRANASIGMLRAIQANAVPGAALMLTGSTPAPFNTPATAYKVLPGAQMQVMALASRTTANGGQRHYINNDTCDTGQCTTSVTGYNRVLIGATAAAVDNSAVPVTSAFNNFDIYEIAIWNGEVINTNSDACVAAAVSNFEIPQLDSQLLLEGDSITDAIGTTLPTTPTFHGSISTWLTEPGANLIPGNVRVISLGISGSNTSGAVTRRDAVNATSTFVYPGGPSKNVVAIQLGRNDLGEGAGNRKNSAMFYADIVALWNTASTGYLQRGWSGVQVANIAGTNTTVTINVSPPTENTLQKRIEAVRLLIADETNKTPNPTFLNDCLAGAGQAYDGLLDVLHLYALSDGGNQWFYDAVLPTDRADATPPGPYDTDDTHLVAEGCRLMATGGDTPQYGYGSIF
jgi:lysophospholipase L1-like esterase